MRQGYFRRGFKAGLVALLVLGGAVACLSAGLRGKTVSARTMTRWSRLLCRILNVRLIQRGKPLPGTGLLVANHISWLDIFCIASVCPSFSWPSRKSRNGRCSAGCRGGPVRPSSSAAPITAPAKPRSN